MASEFRFIDDEIWLGNRCVARLRHYLHLRQDEGCQTGANECDRGDEGSGADHGCLVGGLSR